MSYLYNTVYNTAAFLVSPITNYWYAPPQTQPNESLLKSKLNDLNVKRKITPPTKKLTQVITFSELYAAVVQAPKKVDGLLDEMHLKQRISAMTSAKNPLRERLEKMVLLAFLKDEKLSLLEVKPFKYSEGWCLLASHEQIATMPTNKLHGTPLERKILNQRIEWIFAHQSELLEQEAKKDFDVDVSIGKVLKSTGQQISNNIGVISQNVFFYISVEQLPTLDFSGLSVIAVNACLNGNENEDEIIKRISVLTPEQYKILFKKISKKLVPYVPIEAFKYVSVTELSQQDISVLFPGTSEMDQQRFSQLDPQFHQLNPEEAAKLFKKFSLVQYQLFSHEYIRTLPLEELTSEQLYYIFCMQSAQINKQKFSTVTSKQINDHLDKWGSMLNLLSDEQIRGLDTSKLSKDHLYVLLPPCKAENLFSEYEYQVVKTDHEIKHSYKSIKFQMTNEFGENKISLMIANNKQIRDYRVRLLTEKQLKPIEYYLQY